ncbi:MAG: META domain-containing protein [Rhodobacter sp.]|nr:META domain-containing protein [Paracoccaceae bacterium]MCC0076441.1 META domain-containing protein [Rhodobacter sp.]
MNRLLVTAVAMATLLPIGAGADEAPLSVWSIVAVSGTATENGAEIAFSADGHASGTSGCNRFSGAVSQQGDVLTLGPLASTRMACPEPLSSQEAAIFALLGQPLRVAVDLTTGSATLTAADGATLALQRRRQ